MYHRIRDWYNPENDTIPNGPSVTWAEYALYKAIESLERRVSNMEGELEKLKFENAKLRACVKDASTLASGESLI